jgi:hypothetical protein
MRPTPSITTIAAAAVLAGPALAQNLDPALVTQPADVDRHEAPAAEMVQLGRVVLMGADPLPRDGIELAAPTANVEAERARFAAR